MYFSSPCREEQSVGIRGRPSHQADERITHTPVTGKLIRCVDLVGILNGVQMKKNQRRLTLTSVCSYTSPACPKHSGVRSSTEFIAIPPQASVSLQPHESIRQVYFDLHYMTDRNVFIFNVTSITTGQLPVYFTTQTGESTCYSKPLDYTYAT